MTTTPLPPANLFVAGYPKIVRSVSMSRVGGRALSFVEYADPFWSVEMRTIPLTDENRLLIEVFGDKCGAGLDTVLYTPTRKQVPTAYWDDVDNAVLSNDGSLASITNGRELLIDSVTNGLSLQQGDIIGLKTNDYRALARVQFGGLASGSSISITVEPFVPSYISTSAVVTFKNPSLNMRVVPGSFEISDDRFAVASFTLVEVPK